MDSIIFLIFAVTIVAIVALGRPIRGKLDKTGAEVHTYIGDSLDKSREKIQLDGHMRQ